MKSVFLFNFEKIGLYFTSINVQSISVLTQTHKTVGFLEPQITIWQLQIKLLLSVHLG